MNKTINKNIKIKKKSINEISLRQALYWIDEKFTWDLQEADEFWKIVLSGPAEDIEKEVMIMLEDLMKYRDTIEANKDVLIPDVHWNGSRKKVQTI